MDILNSDKVISSAVVLVVASIMMMASVNIDGQSVIITDDNENRVDLDYLPNHIVTIGIGATMTVIGLNSVDKITVCDSYSAQLSGTGFDKLRERISEGKTFANGNITKNGIADLQRDIENAVNKHLLDKESDIIIATISNPEKLDFLKDNGFKNILIWNVDGKSVEDIDQFIQSINSIFHGAMSSIPHLQDIRESVDKYLKINNIPLVKAQYISYINGFKIGSSASLQAQMISIAGGDPHTYEITGITEAVDMDLSEYAKSYPETLFFVDSEIIDNAELMGRLLGIIGNDCKVSSYDKLWNCYSFYSIECIKTLAESMYPGITPYLEQNNNTNQEGPDNQYTTDSGQNSENDENDTSADKEDSGHSLSAVVLATIAVIAVLSISTFIIIRRK